MKNNVKVQDDAQSLQSCVSVSVIELRIGNLVECFGIREVTAIKNHKIKVQHESKNGNFISEWCPIKSPSLSAIPLTEEWLLKLDFEKLVGWDDTVYFNNNGIHIYLSGNHKEDWFEYENDVVIKSVHQLQNLYFALIGSELQIGSITEH